MVAVQIANISFICYSGTRPVHPICSFCKRSNSARPFTTALAAVYTDNYDANNYAKATADCHYPEEQIHLHFVCIRPIDIVHVVLLICGVIGGIMVLSH